MENVPEVPEPKQLWDQQPRETDRGYAAFCCYRNISTAHRSIKIATKSFYGESSTQGQYKQMQGWSSRNSWVARVGAFDSSRQDMIVETDREAIREMRFIHVREAQGLQSIALEGMKRIQKKMDKDPDYMISPGLVLQLMQQGSNMERLSRGEPDTIRQNLDGKQFVDVVWDDDADEVLEAEEADYEVCGEEKEKQSDEDWYQEIVAGVDGSASKAASRPKDDQEE